MKKFVVLLIMIFVFAGSAQARISSSRTFAHFPNCTDGLVKKICVRRSAINPLGPPRRLCPSGWYCHNKLISCAAALARRCASATTLAGKAQDGNPRLSLTHCTLSWIMMMTTPTVSADIATGAGRKPQRSVDMGYRAPGRQGGASPSLFPTVPL